MSLKKRKLKSAKPESIKTKLRKNDPVMVIAGGSSASGKELKGKIGTISSFNTTKSRAYVSGLNLVKRHKRQTSNQDAAGIVEKEASIHISNLMYFVEKEKRPVRITSRTLDDGRKVRGFLGKEKGDFQQIDFS